MIYKNIESMDFCDVIMQHYVKKGSNYEILIPLRRGKLIKAFITIIIILITTKEK